MENRVFDKYWEQKKIASKYAQEVLQPVKDLLKHAEGSPYQVSLQRAYHLANKFMEIISDRELESEEKINQAIDIVERLEKLIQESFPEGIPSKDDKAAYSVFSAITSKVIGGIIASIPNLENAYKLQFPDELIERLQKMYQLFNPSGMPLSGRITAASTEEEIKAQAVYHDIR